MDIIVYGSIFLGAALMITNIVRFIIFIRTKRDVLSEGDKFGQIMSYVSLVLLCFFFIGYMLVAILGEPDLIMAGILFGGSIFVAIVLTLMFRLISTVKGNALDIAKTLISVIDARDPNLKGHSRYVQNLTMLLYEHLPADKKSEINQLSLDYASLMHDVGKLGVPEAILNKPAKLTDEEWEIMKTHPKVGVSILDEALPSFKAILPWIEYHHERIDGKGYYSIPGDQIPYPAKIIAVADTYSAITMRRSYKDPRTHEDAINIMKEVAGTQLDADLVSILCSIPKEQLMACVPEMVEV